MGGTDEVAAGFDGCGSAFLGGGMDGALVLGIVLVALEERGRGVVEDLCCTEGLTILGRTVGGVSFGVACEAGVGSCEGFFRLPGTGSLDSPVGRGMPRGMPVGLDVGGGRSMLACLLACLSD